MDAVPMVRVVRSGVEESVHTGDAAVVEASGKLVAWAGDPDRPLFARSSMKPLQATVSLSFAPFEFGHSEVSVMCASHNAEPVHLEAVRRLLARAGVDESALQTPSVRPWDDGSLGRDPTRRPINSDCSGKHAGMLAACVAQGWPLETYRQPEHPLQRAVFRAVQLASGREDLAVGVDGCGVPVHGMRLREMARTYAILSAPGDLGDLATVAARAVAAMRAEPYLVAGRNRPDTAVMQETPDVVAKGGAEGLICGAVLDRGLGVAVKIRDGGSGRASGPAFIRVLTSLEVLTDAQVDRLATFARPQVLGGGEPVGQLIAEFGLDFPV
jgi:L-asparaginase II